MKGFMIWLKDYGRDPFMPDRQYKGGIAKCLLYTFT
jgi:hypothetical protein